MRGGQIPGLAPETLDKIMKEYLKRMYAAAETAKRGKLVTAESRYLSPPEMLPQALTTQVMQETDMSYPDRRQTQSIRVSLYVCYQNQTNIVKNIPYRFFRIVINTIYSTGRLYAYHQQFGNKPIFSFVF